MLDLAEMHASTRSQRMQEVHGQLVRACNDARCRHVRRILVQCMRAEGHIPLT
jgi:hypothetical protein